MSLEYKLPNSLRQTEVFSEVRHRRPFTPASVVQICLALINKA